MKVTETHIAIIGLDTCWYLSHIFFTLKMAACVNSMQTHDVPAKHQRPCSVTTWQLWLDSRVLCSVV